ncbi:hypothetical protein ES703_08705 [subsurface metagenome]
MGEFKFDSNGKFIGVGGKLFERTNRFKPSPLKHLLGKKHRCQICGRPINHRGNCFSCNIQNKRASELAMRDLLGNKLETSEDSEALKKSYSKKFDNSQDTEYWSLYKDNQILPPLRFSNNKTQEDVVEEVINLIRTGTKIIFLHGVCGTGKSAIALNIARVLGKAAIVVPVKGLQRQYQEDYMGKMFLLKSNGEKLRISMITGRANHDSIFMSGISCADPFLPDTIQIIEKNFKILKEYYEKNPLIQHKNAITNLNQLKRISIAPINPYWSPIIPSKYHMNLPDAKMKSYKGLRDTDFTFYHRKKGCSYYDQYDAYLDSDVIIFNAAKYKIETALDRKPETEIDIIDEADEFLDSFSSQSELNLARLKNSLANLYSEHEDTMDLVSEILKLIKLEEKNKKATGIDENKIFHINDTKIRRILSLMLKDGNIESETYSDDAASNYVSKVLEIARQFEDFFDDTYLTYRDYEKNLYINLVTTNLSKRLQEVLDKNKAFVFMSGTLHSKTVLEKVFGITNYKTVEAETILPGTVEIHQTGKEFDCKYSNFNSGKITKENYFEVLSDCIEKATRPTLVHVNAFTDLPSDEETIKFSLKSVISREKLIGLQKSDKTGKLISEFKKKLSNILYSTKCSRGVDFPGDTCCSVLFTKYPNPSLQNTFWKILKMTHPQYFWDFYKDKARREFLQRLYRALRSQEDHVFVLSPDSRVLEAVKDLQLIKKNATSLDIS